MVQINLLQPAAYLVSSSQAKREGLVIHGYGSNKEEILGLAVGLASCLDLKLLVFDLPGHGQADSFLTLDNCLEALNQAKTTLKEPTFFIGHSLGAYLGLMTKLPMGVLISMPGKALFEGNRRDLLRILRAKRVRESSPYAGLGEILSIEVKPVSKMLMLRAENELKSVVDLITGWKSLGFEGQKVVGSNHLDIISAPSTVEIISQWLKKNLI